MAKMQKHHWSDLSIAVARIALVVVGVSLAAWGAWTAATGQTQEGIALIITGTVFLRTVARLKRL